MLDNFLKIINQVNRTLLTCTYVLSIGVLRTRGLRSRFALHVIKMAAQSQCAPSERRQVSMMLPVRDNAEGSAGFQTALREH